MTQGVTAGLLIVGQGVTVWALIRVQAKLGEWTATNLLLYRSMLEALGVLARLRIPPPEIEPSVAPMTADESMVQQHFREQL